MKWLLFLFPILLHAAVNLRDPAFISSTASSVFVAPPESGYTLWIDFGDTNIVFQDAAGTVPSTNNAVVRRANDKSTRLTNSMVAGMFNNISAPTFRTTNMFPNNLPGIHNGGLWASNSVSSATSLGIASAFTVYTVAKPPVGSAGSAFAVNWYYKTSGTRLFALRRNNTASALQLVDPSDGAPVVSGTTYTQNLIYVWCSQVSTTTLRLYEGLVPLADASYGPTALTTNSTFFSIGAEFGVNDQLWDCDFGEVILYPVFHTGAQVTNVIQNYLIPKWGARSSP